MGNGDGELDAVASSTPATNDFLGLNLDTGFSNTSSLGINSTANTSGGLVGTSIDLFDLLGGDLLPASAAPPVLQTGATTNPQMPLFSNFPNSLTMNGRTDSSASQHELIPGQYFPSSFFSLSKAEQNSQLRQRAEQDGIMSG